MSNKPIIKVLGVGGGGCNAISYMSYKEIEGVELLAANTDVQDLDKIKDIQKIQIGNKETSGLGAGADPKVGRKAAEENEDEIRKFLEGSNLLILSSGMGGGTGTGASPVIAKIAKEMGMLVIAVVTTPFDFEREHRMSQAQKGIEELKEHVDSLICIPNNKLKNTIEKGTSLMDVFKIVDNVLHRAIEGISDIITKPGFINIDFNDLKTIMTDSGNSMIGLGYGSGENKARDAALDAIKCELLEENNLARAKRAVVNITLGLDGSFDDFEEIGEVIKEITAEGANVIVGTSIDERLENQAKVTIIATDFLPASNTEDDTKNKEKEIEEINDKNELPSFSRRTIKKSPINFEQKISTHLEDHKNETNEKNDSTFKGSDENKIESSMDENKDQKLSKIPDFLRRSID